MDNKENTKKSTAGKLIIHLLIDAFLLVSFILLNNMRSTGKSLHEILGVAIGVSILVHLILHWKMIVGYFKKTFKKPEFISILRLVVNIALCASLFVIIITGLLMSHTLLPSLGIQVRHAGREIEMVHKQITHYAIYILGLHLLLQWKWYAVVVKRLIINPIASLFGKKQSKEIA